MGSWNKNEALGTEDGTGADSKDRTKDTRKIKRLGDSVEEVFRRAQGVFHRLG